jgi:hypothetical protein
MAAAGDGRSAWRCFGEVWEGRASFGASVERGEASGSDDLGRVALKKRRHGGVTSPASMAGGGRVGLVCMEGELGSAFYRQGKRRMSE